MVVWRKGEDEAHQFSQNPPMLPLPPLEVEVEVELALVAVPVTVPPASALVPAVFVAVLDFSTAAVVPLDPSSSSDTLEEVFTDAPAELVFAVVAAAVVDFESSDVEEEEDELRE